MAGGRVPTEDVASGPTKGRLFVGSSEESIHVAKVLQSALQDLTHVTIWQNAFDVGEDAIDDLTAAAHLHDFAAFVFTPDDGVASRGTTAPTSRDLNVAMQLGLVSTVLRPGRTFVVVPDSGSVKLPSDLLGIEYATYRAPDAPPSDARWEAAVRPAARKIRSAIERLPQDEAASAPPNGRTASNSLATAATAAVKVAILREFSSEAPVTALTLGQLSGDPVAVAGGEDAVVRIWGLRSDTPVSRSLKGHDGPVWAVALSQLGSRPVAVSASNDRSLRVWDLDSGSVVGEPLVGHTDLVNAVALGHLRGRPVAVSASDDRTVRVWDLEKGSPIGQPLIGHTDWVNGVALIDSATGPSVIVSGSTDRTVRLWDLESGRLLRTLGGHTDSVSSVTGGLLSDGRRVAVSGGMDQTVRLWDVESGDLVRTLTGHTSGVRAVAFGLVQNHPTVVSGANDSTVRVWELQDSKWEVSAFAVHTAPVRAVALGLLEGKSVVASGGEDNRVRIWAPAKGPLPRDQVEWQSDAPADRDLLRRRPLAQSLATRLRRIYADEPETSFLLHIDGPWGTGKSTLLNLLREELQNDWLIVDFDAWRQSRVGPPWWSLLTTLRRSIGRDLRVVARTRLRLVESWGRLRRAGAPLVLALIALLITAVAVFLLLRPQTLTATNQLIQTVTAVVSALGTLWAGTLVVGRFLLWDSARGARLFEQSNANPMEAVAEHFAWLIGKVQRPVAFFIDDLDRCSDSYVVELLDAVQTLIRDAGGRTIRPSGGSRSAPYFIIAADGAWIRKSYEIAYDKFVLCIAEPGRPLGYLFLDKLFQLRVQVPFIDPIRQQEYLRTLLQIPMPNPESGALDAEEQAARASVQSSSTEAQVVEALRQASTEVRGRVAAAAVEKLTTPEVSAATEHSLQRFGPLLMPNPRSMKRFVNVYSALRAVRTLEGNPVATEPLALWTIMETRWPSLADYLRARPEAVELVRVDKPDLEAIPSDLRVLFDDPEVRELTDFHAGGPLTPELIRACCGAESGYRR